MLAEPSHGEGRHFGQGSGIIDRMGGTGDHDQSIARATSVRRVVLLIRHDGILFVGSRAVARAGKVFSASKGWPDGKGPAAVAS